VADGAFDAVLVHDPDRLARNYVHQMLLVEEFERHGCRLHFARRPIGRTPAERLLLQMQGVIAEYERAKIRERTRRGKLHRMRNGETVAGRRTFGYRYYSKHGDSPARFEVVPEEAEVVRKVFDWFANGQGSIRGVAARLNEDVAAKPLRGGRWSSSNIHNILRNSMYYGVGHANRVEAVLPTRDRPLQPVYRKYPKTGKRERPREEWLPFNCPAIVAEETYRLAQDRLARNKELSSRNTRHDYLLRGLVICGDCGRRFQASPQTGRYICAYTRRQVAEAQGVACCGNTMRPGIAELDDAVWKAVVDLIKRPSTLRKYHKLLHGQILPKSCSDGDLAGRKERLEERIRRINDLYVRGDIDRSGHAERMRAAREELHKVTSKIDKLKEQHLEDDEIEQMLQSFASFSSSIKKEIAEVDFATRRHIVENMVKRLIVGKNDITIEYAAPLKRSSLCTTSRER
jgi:site-specific DNA recombinase